MKMQYSIPVKFAAMLLCACALVAAVGGGVGVAFLASEDLYNQTVSDWADNYNQRYANSLTDDILSTYVYTTHSNCPPELLREVTRGWHNGSYYYAGTVNFYVTVADSRGKTVYATPGTPSGSVDSAVYRSTSHLTREYPVLLSEVPHDRDTDLAMTDPPAESAPTDPDALQYSYWKEVQNGEQIYMQATVIWKTSPEYTVSVYLLSEPTALPLLRLLYELRYAMLAALILGILLFMTALVFLFCAAGHAPGSDTIRAGGLNRLPLDLYAAAVFGLEAFSVWLMAGLSSSQMLLTEQYRINWGGAVLALLLAVGMALAPVGFLFAFAAQVKTGGSYWWHNSIVGRACRLLWKFLRRLLHVLHRMWKLLPLVWQWLLTAAGMALLCLIAYSSYSPFFRWWTALVCLSVILYGAYAFGTILSAAKQMAAGTLQTKINTRYLIGAFRTCAEHLNALASIAVQAAQEQFKSERMKVELITNVSHDIKTPLTSVINYVDLLQKPHTEEEGTQYLEVLARQSQQLKKLIDDLMEMSKASTGNIAVNIAKVDAVETVNQALGEFSGKLSDARLTPVFRQPEAPVPMLADGRLAWRVLSNLLINAVKYAQPETRLYLDIARESGNVLISLKNISKEALNISADELMERFVRGDASRNTEGSGLGLNIAKSLMELQHGQLWLLVDGDLFKVTMVFPGA